MIKLRTTCNILCVLRSTTNSSSMADSMNTKTLAGRSPFQNEGQSVALQRSTFILLFFLSQEQIYIHWSLPDLLVHMWHKTLGNHNWAREASPILGCSIEISRDWRASEASETPSIATYRKKCLGVSTSKPQCACSQFYVKRRSGRACIYEKPACCSRVQLRIRQNDKAHAHQITLLSLAP